jgi:hypothetical protein
VGGGHKKFSRIGREQILNAYRAGPDAIVSLIDYLQETLLGIIEEHEARIGELEAKLNKDSPPGAMRKRRRKGHHCAHTRGVRVVASSCLVLDLGGS